MSILKGGKAFSDAAANVARQKTLVHGGIKVAKGVSKAVQTGGKVAAGIAGAYALYKGAKGAVKGTKKLVGVKKKTTSAAGSGGGAMEHSSPGSMSHFKGPMAAAAAAKAVGKKGGVRRRR